MQWLVTVFKPIINSAIQRLVYNPTTTATGGIMGVLGTAVAYLATQGCVLDTLDYVGLFLALSAPQALSTDANKALVTHEDGRVSTVPVDPGPPTVGDDAHVKEGGNSF